MFHFQCQPLVLPSCRLSPNLARCNLREALQRMQCDERACASERRTLSQRSIDIELICLVEFLEVKVVYRRWCRMWPFRNMPSWIDIIILIEARGTRDMAVFKAVPSLLDGIAYKRCCVHTTR